MTRKSTPNLTRFPLGSHSVPSDLVPGSSVEDRGEPGNQEQVSKRASSRELSRGNQVTVLVTADISGKKTNRVRVPARSPLTRSVTPTDPSPQRAVRRYKADRIAERGPGTVIAVSIPAQDLCAMDELAERLRMSRSHLIREAVRAFAANSNEPEEP